MHDHRRSARAAITVRAYGELIDLVSTNLWPQPAKRRRFVLDVLLGHARPTVADARFRQLVPHRYRCRRQDRLMSQYYWCFTHNIVEVGTTCRAANRLGPYESAEAARNWQERVEQRDDAWKAEDKRWEGDDSR